MCWNNTFGSSRKHVDLWFWNRAGEVSPESPMACYGFEFDFERGEWSNAVKPFG